MDQPSKTKLGSPNQKLGYTVEVHKTGSEELYGGILRFLSKQFAASCHHVELVQARKSAFGAHAGLSTLSNNTLATEYLLGSGTHELVFEGVPLRVERFSAASGATSNSLGQAEGRLVLSVPLHQATVLQHLITQCVDTENNERLRFVQYYVPNLIGASGEWRPLCARAKTSPDAYVLVSSQRAVYEDVKVFLADTSHYKRHRGYLLYGSPGNGKTSFVHLIASVHQRDVYVFSATTRSLDDTSLLYRVARIPPNSIVVVDDLDAVPAANSNTQHIPTSSVTFAGLSNCFDGHPPLQGCLVFFTTNRLDSIDVRLLRVGRIHVKCLFDPPNDEQALKMLSRYLPDISAADLDEYLRLVAAKRQLKKDFSVSYLQQTIEESAKCGLTLNERVHDLMSKLRQ